VRSPYLFLFLICLGGVRGLSGRGVVWIGSFLAMAFVAVMFVPVVRIGVSDPGRVRARSVRVVRSGGCVVLSAKRSNDGIKPERPGDAESNGFVPRGPTMRQLYEESGRLPRTVTDKSEGALPQVVADRMFKRMMILFGAPFLLGLSTFIGLFVLNYRYEIAFQPSVVGFTTLGTFGIALMGLTYGMRTRFKDSDVGATDL